MDELRFLDHTGDIGFDVRSDTVEGLFRRAARGLYEILLDREDSEHPAEAAAEAAKADETISLTEPALDLLLRSFLSELLFRFLTERAILADFTGFRIHENRLHATARAARFDPARDGLRTELKAVTYHQLDVKRDASGWSARVIFDV